ncbi:dioxygenase [Janibacter sp. GXQ6167]|uniref:dioxygenase family protein n=1 Tax=Janibacter sp. GXQ6167 TaxID=3240791 RepID=UPI0035265107
MTRTPTLFLSHGAPPLADDPTWPDELASWASSLPRPEAILVVSAHWEAAPVTLSPTTGPVPLTYDFWGFPQRYYEVTYEAPQAPALAERVSSLLASAGQSVRRDEARGLDHGAYVPLVEMYPNADIPVLQMSMPTLDPSVLYDLGRQLAPLRDEGALIMGSGFTTHNLSWFNPREDAAAAPPTVSAEFDAWAAEALAEGNVDALLDTAHRAPAAHIAHPRSEHWAPLYLALGAADGDAATSRVDGFWYGLSKRSWDFGG